MDGGPRDAGCDAAESVGKPRGPTAILVWDKPRLEDLG